MGRVERTREIARRRTRRTKLKKLRTAYAAAKSDGAKGAILEKARRISPLVKLED